MHQHVGNSCLPLYIMDSPHKTLSSAYLSVPEDLVSRRTLSWFCLHIFCCGRGPGVEPYTCQGSTLQMATFTPTQFVVYFYFKVSFIHRKKKYTQKESNKQKLHICKPSLCGGEMLTHKRHLTMNVKERKLRFLEYQYLYSVKTDKQRIWVKKLRIAFS